MIYIIVNIYYIIYIIIIIIYVTNIVIIDKLFFKSEMKNLSQSTDLIKKLFSIWIT